MRLRLMAGVTWKGYYSNLRATFRVKFPPARQPQESSAVESDSVQEVLPNVWLGGRDSNPDTQIQSLQSYR
jgi:hypothetical protein